MTTTRREFLRAGAFAATAVSAGCVSVPFAKGAAKSSDDRKPNILFIIADDQRLEEFGFIGGKALTPNIDRLAREGVYCERAYASSTVCTPSRYTCLTGRYASRSRDDRVAKGVSREGQYWIHWNADVAPEETNVAKVLKRAGYATGIVGKLHGFVLPKQSEQVTPESDPRDPKVKAMLEKLQKEYAEALKDHGFDYAAALNRANLGSAKSLPDPLRRHSPEWKAEAAVRFIEENKDRPWYLYYATPLTHGPSPLESLQDDARVTEAGILDEPPRAQPSRQSVLERCEKADVPQSLAGAAWLDDSIGAMLKKLDDLKLAENTLVVYFNDHGVEGGKGTLYESGARTPVIFRWPGKIAHGKKDALVENIDFVPTILSAAGVSPPDGMKMDGVDLLPFLTGRAAKTRESLFLEIGHTRAVVTKKWKYLAFRVPPSIQKPKEERARLLEEYHRNKPSAKESYYDPEGRITHINRVPGGDGTERGNGLSHYKKHYFDPDQLYDLEKDPGERTNLAGDPRYGKILSEMQGELKRLLSGVPGTFGEFKTKT